MPPNIEYDSLEEAIGAALNFYHQMIDEDAEIEVATLRVCRQSCEAPEDGCEFCYQINPRMTAHENATRCKTLDG